MRAVDEGGPVRLNRLRRALKWAVAAVAYVLMIGAGFIPERFGGARPETKAAAGNGVESVKTNAPADVKDDRGE